MLTRSGTAAGEGRGGGLKKGKMGGMEGQGGETEVMEDMEGGRGDGMKTGRQRKKTDLRRNGTVEKEMNVAEGDMG